MVLAASLLISPPLRADLDGDVSTLQAAWATQAKVAHLPPRLVERSDDQPIPLQASSLDPSGGDCLTVAALGVV